MTDTTTNTTRPNTTEDHDFSEGLEQLKQGAICYRKGWNGIQRGVQMYVMLIREHEYAPHFVFYNSEHQTTNIWIPSMWDMMADDWVIEHLNISFSGTASIGTTGTTGTIEYALDGTPLGVKEASK